MNHLMATKADLFRAREILKARKPLPKRPRKRRDDQVDTSRKGVSATDRRAGGHESGMRNVRTHAGQRGGAALEDTATGRPSRKSTRKSADRTKRTTNQQLRAQMRTASAPARAARGRVGRS
jgi:hypothetical protein